MNKQNIIIISEHAYNICQDYNYLDELYKVPLYMDTCH